VRGFSFFSKEVSLNQNITNFLNVMRASMIGRDEEIDTITLALVAREHCCLIGDPGTGKSYAVGNAIKAMSATNFQILMTVFTTPEEVFGPLALTELQKDRYVRNLEKRACEAELFFADEIFKSSSAILNSLLTMMQEREYDNGGVRIKCPLRTMIAASNELPEPGLLDAMYDRFILRRLVKPLPKPMRRQLLTAKFPTVTPVCTVADFDQAHTAAMALPVRSDTLDAFEKIWDLLEQQGIKIGDRRAAKAINVAKAAAYIAGANAVYIEHLSCLCDVFWTSLDQIAEVKNIVLRECNPDEIILNEYAEEIADLDAKFTATLKDKYAMSNALAKMQSVLDTCSSLKQTPKRDAIAEAAQGMHDRFSSAASGQSIETIKRLRAMTEARRRQLAAQSA
jgi:MoxR-like ATPase